MSTFDEMVEFLDASYVLKDQIVPCLIGPVGIGKTEAVLQHAKNVNANKVVEIIASQILPNEVSGITMPDPETRAMEIYDHFRLSSLEDGDILFFDELLEADQMVLSACLTLIESRTMMSGKALPDIQIIGATNPTIQPRMLKPSIRQRFMFRKFNIDPVGCRKFIKSETSVDVADLVNRLEEDSDEYNILSQRSLTKLVRWMDSAEDDAQRNKIALHINRIYNSDIGSVLKNKVWDKYHPTKEKQAKDAIANVFNSLFDSTEDLVDQNRNSLTLAEADKLMGLSQTFEDMPLMELINLIKNWVDEDTVQLVFSELEDIELIENESSSNSKIDF